MLNNKSGIDMKIIKDDIKNLEDRNKIEHLVNALDAKGRGNILIALYFVIKILNLVVSIANLRILYFLLGSDDFFSIGKNVITKIWYDPKWSNLERFPRAAMCEFIYLHENNPYTVI